MASLMDMPTDDKKTIKLTPEQAMETGLAYIKSDPENVIRFRAPYAQRQYYGEDFNFTKDVHQLAQAQWAQVAADLHGEEIISQLINYVKNKEKNL